MAGGGRRGRLLMEALIALLILGALLAAIGDLYRQGARVRRRVDVRQQVRGLLADELAAARAALVEGEVEDRALPLGRALPGLVGMEGNLVRTVEEADGGALVRLKLVARWRLGEHNGEEVRDVLIYREAGR